MTVYVSSDHDKGAAGTAQFEHGWDFAVPFEDKALRSELKKRYSVWAMIENGQFGEVRVLGWGAWIVGWGGAGIRGWTFDER